MNGSAVSELTEAYGLHRAGQFTEAASRYREILRTQPNNSQALYLLGVLHFQRGKFHDAEHLMGQALALSPTAPDALYNRGRALMQLRRPENALPLFDRLLSLNPKIAEAWHSRGVALSALGRLEEALTSYDTALALGPASASLNNRANVLFDLKRFEEAAAAYERIWVSDPHVPHVLGNLVFSRLQCCDWRDLEKLKQAVSDGVRTGARVVEPGVILALSPSPPDQLRAAHIWIANEAPAGPALWRGERYRHERIRLAYVSADFRSHAVAYLIAGVMEAHDASRFEVIAVSLGVDDGSAVRERIVASCEQFIDASRMSDDEVASLLRAREIDIAVDLVGLTGGTRTGIFARRPAPIQVSYLGFPATMGAPYMDYLIADRVVVPENEAQFYREAIAYLPDCYLPCETKIAAAPAPSRAAAGLPDTGFVFCAFANAYKITPEIFDVWLRLLGNVPGSVLWLAASNDAAMRNLRGWAQASNIAPARLIFAPFASARAYHLARLSLADLGLDTLPYGGHATALDALSAGVPVVTCEGKAFAGRVATSLVQSLGLHELAARSLAGYEETALKLATEPDALAGIRAKLLRNRADQALFDIVRYTRGLEAAFMRMQERPPA